LDSGSSIDEEGNVQSTLDPEDSANYQATLIEAMQKVITTTYNEYRKRKDFPQEKLAPYEDVREAAIHMIKTTLGLPVHETLPHEKHKPIIHQRDVPADEDTAYAMLRYFVDTEPRITNVHATFGATKDAALERDIIDQAMGQAVKGLENGFEKLQFIDREWEATEHQGEIRVQTAYNKAEYKNPKAFITRHWKVLPKMIHEVLHALTHPRYKKAAESYRTATGKNTLIEGVTDLLKNLILDAWSEEKLSLDNKVMDLIVGKPRPSRASAEKFSSKDYDEMAIAQNIEKITTLENVIQAYIHGHIELIGLGDFGGEKEEDAATMEMPDEDVTSGGMFHEQAIERPYPYPIKTGLVGYENTYLTEENLGSFYAQFGQSVRQVSEQTFEGDPSELFETLGSVAEHLEWQEACYRHEGKDTNRLHYWAAQFRDLRS
jgi:hypothetical protein